MERSLDLQTSCCIDPLALASSHDIMRELWILWSVSPAGFTSGAACTRSDKGTLINCSFFGHIDQETPGAERQDISGSESNGPSLKRGD